MHLQRMNSVPSKVDPLVDLPDYSAVFYPVGILHCTGRHRLCENAFLEAV